MYFVCTLWVVAWHWASYSDTSTAPLSIVDVVTVVAVTSVSVFHRRADCALVPWVTCLDDAACKWQNRESIPGFSDSRLCP